jgi:hypothetical protein
MTKDIAICSFRQTCKKNVDCTIRTVLMWQLTVQVVRPYNDVAGCIGTDMGR